MCANTHKDESTFRKIHLAFFTQGGIYNTWTGDIQTLRYSTDHGNSYVKRLKGNLFPLTFTDIC